MGRSVGEVGGGVEGVVDFAAVGGAENDVALIVAEHQGSERQGDNHAEQAEQRAPHRERQQDDGGIEPHGLAHDFGREEEVLNALNHTVNQHRLTEDNPEAVGRLRAVDQT